MLNPCCCISPRIGTFVLAIIDLVFAILGGLYYLRLVFDHQHNEYLVELALSIGLLLMAILLLTGAMQNSVEKLRLWLVLWIVILVCYFLLGAFNAYYYHPHHRFGVGMGSGRLVIFLYELWVVYAFIYELRYGPAGLTYCPSQVV